MTATTNILAQYRERISALLEQGDASAQEEISRAESRVTLCAQEWRQAEKAVELTAKQEESVLEAKRSGEEKFALIQSEEKDAMTAMEAIRQMVENANLLRTNSNKGTAAIMGKAEDILGATLRDAESFYAQKTAQREEVAFAMERLAATEKAVQYTKAKAMRNEGSCLLDKLIAEKQLAVACAEQEVVSFRRRYAEAEQRQAVQQESLDMLVADLANAEEKAALLDQSVTELRTMHAERIDRCKADYDLVYQKLEEELQHLTNNNTAAENALQACHDDVAQKEQESAAAAGFCTELKAAAEQAAAEAKDALAAESEELEQQISRAEQELAAMGEDVSAAELVRDEAVRERDRVQTVVDEIAARVKDALDEENSAREAAETSSRLAENALKIKESFGAASFSNESAQVLIHAQEVLLEAAASAQQLIAEKNQLRLAAEAEQREQAEILSQAESVLGEKEEMLSAVISRREQAEAALAAEKQSAADRKEELRTAADELQQDYAARCQDAEEKEAEAARLLEEAVQAKEAAVLHLSEIQSQIADNQAAREQTTQELNGKLGEIEQKAGEELGTVQSELDQAKAEVAAMTDRKLGLEAELSDVAAVLVTLAEQVGSAEHKINDIMVAGMAEISAAEGSLQQLTEAEEAARAVAGDAIAAEESAAPVEEPAEIIEEAPAVEPEAAVDVTEAAEPAAEEIADETFDFTEEIAIEAVFEEAPEEAEPVIEEEAVTEEAVEEPAVEEAAEAEPASEEPVAEAPASSERSLNDYMAAIARLEAEMNLNTQEPAKQEDPLRSMWGDDPMTEEDLEYTRNLQMLSDTLMGNTASLPVLNDVEVAPELDAPVIEEEKPAEEPAPQEEPPKKKKRRFSFF